MPTPALNEIRVEDLRPGRRYVDCAEGYESSWTVATVELRLSTLLRPDGAGGWEHWTDVVVTYMDGRRIVHELGTVLVYDVDVADPHPDDAQVCDVVDDLAAREQPLSADLDTARREARIHIDHLCRTRGYPPLVASRAFAITIRSLRHHLGESAAPKAAA